MIVQTDNPVELAKEIFWLAWKACGGPLGMGVLQDRDGVTKEDVWENVSTSGDYPLSRNKPNSPYADYVFCRMMKFGLKFVNDGIEIADSKLDPSYQGWSRKFPTVEKLVEAAQRNLMANNN